MLLTQKSIAFYLGKKPTDIPRVIREDGLPAVRVPTKGGTVQRIPLHGFHRWLAARSENDVPTLQELRAELKTTVKPTVKPTVEA